MAPLALENISFSFPGASGRPPILDRISFRMEPGEFLVVLGPSGSGKDLLASDHRGLEASTSGRILFQGRDITGDPPEKRNVSLLFQSGGLYPFLTAADNLRLGLKLRRCQAAEMEKRVSEITRELNLAPHGGGGGDPGTDEGQLSSATTAWSDPSLGPGIQAKPSGRQRQKNNAHKPSPRLRQKNVNFGAV